MFFCVGAGEGVSLVSVACIHFYKVCDEKKPAYPPTKTNSEFTLEISCFEGLSPNLSSSP